MKKHYESKKEIGKRIAEIADRNAILEKFIHDYGTKAFNYAYRLSGNVEAAKELVQEALYRVTCAWHRYDQSKPLRNWFFTVLWNTFADSQRQTKRWSWVALDAPVDRAQGICVSDTISDGDGDISQTFERAGGEESIRQAIECLRSDYRSVIDLWQMNGMSYKAIAGSLGIPIGTVRSRISRARWALRCDSELVQMVE
jgi:RNA polymerase sigma-70 factor (ECF subfamily)